MSDTKKSLDAKEGNKNKMNIADMAMDYDGNFSRKALMSNLAAAVTTIETNEEKAAQIAAAIDVGAERVDEDISNMYDKIQNIGEVWTGQDSNSFKTVFEELKSKVNENASTLSELAETIKKEANVTAAQNREFTAKAKNSDVLY
jgi:hypothetical protein